MFCVRTTSNASTKTFDTVEMVRVVRDELSARIAMMSADEENRWLRFTEVSDPTLRRLMELAAQQGVAVGGASGS
jgi:chemotaxis regulatin CheY-phosphate phosphatase CheZ